MTNRSASCSSISGGASAIRAKGTMKINATIMNMATSLGNRFRFPLVCGEAATQHKLAKQKGYEAHKGQTTMRLMPSFIGGPAWAEMLRPRGIATTSEHVQAVKPNFVPRSVKGQNTPKWSSCPPLRGHKYYSSCQQGTTSKHATRSPPPDQPWARAHGMRPCIWMSTKAAIRRT